MRSAIVWLGLAACTNQDAPAPPHAKSVEPPPAKPAFAPRPAPAKPATTAVEAPPGGTIQVVATTLDEQAALTIDDGNELRLWPALDGSRAPIVIDLPRPRTVALQRAAGAGGGFVVCAAFDTGTLEVGFDALGQRTQIHELAAFDSVTAIDDGFVVSRGHERRWLDRDGELGAAPLGAKDKLAPLGKPAPPRVTAKGSDLVIHGDAGDRYLGYAFLAGEPPAGPPTGDPAHLVVAGNPGHWLQLTPALAPVRELVPPVDHAVSLRWIGGDDWLIQSLAGLSLWTPGQPARLALPVAPNGHPVDQLDPVMVGSEPETGLVVLNDKRLLRYVADRHALEPIAFPAWDNDTTDLVMTQAIPLAPSLAHGAVLALASFIRDKQGTQRGTVRYIRDLAHPDAGATNWHSDKSWPIGVSRSGVATINKYYDGGGWAVVDATGRERPVPERVAPSFDGQRYFAQGADRALSLIALAAPATPVWTVKLPGSDPMYQRGPIWLDADHALLVTWHGFATLDVATGALANPRAGWQFELAAAPHPTSRLGRPLPAVMAPAQGPPLALAGDGKFQQLVTQVAAASASRITGWGPMQLDGETARVAWLQAHEDTGGPQLSVLVDGPRGVTVVLCSSWGSPVMQGPFPDAPPAWGIAWNYGGAGVEPGRTTERTSLSFATQWIHGSGESLTATRVHGSYLVIGDGWNDRENNGHGFDETSGGLPRGRHPKLDGFVGKSLRCAVSAPSNDPVVLAGAIHDLPMPD